MTDAVSAFWMKGCFKDCNESLEEFIPLDYAKFWLDRSDLGEMVISALIFIFSSLLPNFQIQRCINEKYMYGFYWAKREFKYVDNTLMCIGNSRCSREREMKTACHKIHRNQKKNMGAPTAEILWLHLLSDFTKNLNKRHSMSIFLSKI